MAKVGLTPKAIFDSIGVVVVGAKSTGNQNPQFPGHYTGLPVGFV
jgi:hypothetical protein